MVCKESMYDCLIIRGIVDAVERPRMNQYNVFSR